jgi:hypothetical protein
VPTASYVASIKDGAEHPEGAGVFLKTLDGRERSFHPGRDASQGQMENRSCNYSSST